MPKVSVIIPVYNVEKYLKRCLDSMINQTLKDIEIICVNDGSTDNSLKILEECAQKDTRIKIINQENKGVSSARNQGIKAATGEYLSFIDSDDSIDLNFYEVLYNKAKKENADISKGGFKRIEYNGKCSNLTNLVNGSLEKTKFALNWQWTSAIYKTSIICDNRIYFSEEYIQGEDTIFLFKTLLYTEIIVFDDNIFYYCYRRKGSLNSDIAPAKSITSGIKSKKYISEILNNSNLFDTNFDDYIFAYNMNLKSFFYEFFRTYDKKTREFCAQEFINTLYNCKNIDELQKHFSHGWIFELGKNKNAKKLAQKVTSKYKTREDFYNNRVSSSFLSMIFSVKNEYREGIKRKVITIFGIRIKFKRRNNAKA